MVQWPTMFFRLERNLPGRFAERDFRGLNSGLLSFAPSASLETESMAGGESRIFSGNVALNFNDIIDNVECGGMGRRRA